MKNVAKIVVTFLVFLTILGGFARGIKKDVKKNVEAISMLKKGSLESCPNYTVEQLVNSSIKNPKWERIVDNGITYVNISGLTASGRPADVLMQFWIRADGDGSFGLEAFEIDEEDQNEFVALVFLGQMCEAAKTTKKKAKKAMEEQQQ